MEGLGLIDPSEAIGNSMNVDIDANAIHFIPGMRHEEVRHLRT